jgi:hypothetical protein
LQSAVQSDHDVHSDTVHSTGHAPRLQLIVPVSTGHVNPSPVGFTVMVRSRDVVPWPHV